MGRYQRTRGWLAESKNEAIVPRGWIIQSASERARLDILIGLVWPEALVCPEQEEMIASMIRATLFPEDLTTTEIYKEARAIATYLNSMT